LRWRRQAEEAVDLAHRYAALRPTLCCVQSRRPSSRPLFELPSAL
jgi:hypothetical protein